MFAHRVGRKDTFYLCACVLPDDMPNIGSSSSLESVASSLACPSTAFLQHNMQIFISTSTKEVGG